MKTESCTITNESGKSITIQHIHSAVELTITQAQWRRLVRESDNTVWRTEQGATIAWTCYPYATGCKYPGRR